MHCPRCGNNATTGQQFCRSCGLSLEKVAELLGNELPLEASSRQSELARLRARQQKYQDWGGIAGLITFGLILLLFVILIFTQMILKGGALIPVGLLLVLLAIGAGIMGLFQGYSKSLKEKLANPPLPKPDESDEASKLDSFREPVNSITDRTTELLAPAKSADTGKMNIKTRGGLGLKDPDRDLV